MYDDIGGFAQHGCGVGDDGHAPRRIGCADSFAEIASGFCGIFINGADYLDGAFFAKQANDCGTDGANSVLNGANLLFLQSCSPFFREKFRCANQDCENGARARFI